MYMVLKASKYLNKRPFAMLVAKMSSRSLEGQEESLILGNKIPQDEAGLWALPRAEVNL